MKVIIYLRLCLVEWLVRYTYRVFTNSSFPLIHLASSTARLRHYSIGLFHLRFFGHARCIKVLNLSPLMALKINALLSSLTIWYLPILEKVKKFLL